jgi:hypothetical protein
MNLRKEILREHSKLQAARIQRHVGNDATRFGELVSIFLSGPYRVTQRAAWPLSMCVEKHPELAGPHLKVLLQNLNKENLHDAVKRNTMRLLQYVQVPKRLQGLAADMAFRFLQDPKEPVAVRVFSMTVLANIAREVPELKKELLLILEDQLPYGSAGFLARAKKVIKELSEKSRKAM